MILVDNGSADGTVASVPAVRPDATVVELGRNRGAPARNLGVRLASTPYVAFADDDSWWHAGALARAADVLDAHPRAAVVAARVLVGAACRDDPICAVMAAAPLGRDPDLPGPSILGFLACAVVVRRSAFLDVGGFDDVVFFGGEEERVALDLGRRRVGAGLRVRPGGASPSLPGAGRRSPGGAAREESRPGGRAAATVVGGRSHHRARAPVGTRRPGRCAGGRPAPVGGAVRPPTVAEGGRGGPSSSRPAVTGRSPRFRRARTGRPSTRRTGGSHHVHHPQPGTAHG